ncbi:hypothetical protein EJ02DRAFT_436992 [Clathrospora elynae]|uniref:Uncharacterized protein n=1 Tax=Clathrospora elynae TaxID=706981 RepID=A0A6A5SG96_9PLEO|nr:hypothetical protein EJ02DRAFT_436992 [Clathrospora elynae]
MGLLDLPTELFQRIVGYLVSDVGPLNVAEYRLISKMFASEIQEEMLVRQPLIAYSGSGSKEPGHAETQTYYARFEQLFARYGGTILGHKVLQKHKNSPPIIHYLKELTESVFCLYGQATDELQKQYTIDICTAFSSVYWKQFHWRIFLANPSDMKEPSTEDDLPAALAAVGEIQPLLDMIAGDIDRLLADCSSLPSPLDAAAACGQTEVVRAILDRVAQNLRSDADQYSATNQHLQSALVSATRKGARQCADIIVNFLQCDEKLSLRSYHVRRHCLRQVDTGLVRRFLLCTRDAKLHSDNWSCGLAPEEFELIFLNGSCSVLRALLQDGFVDPHHFGDTTPLTVAVRNHRYDLARVLMQNGAHVDGVSKTGKPVTALWHAAKAGYRGYGTNRLPGVRFLLQHGADPDIHGDWRSPLRAAEDLWPDVRFLLQQAKEHGNDVAVHPNVWKRFHHTQSDKMHINADELP